MSQPLISAVICVRDGENYLREALDSVAAQAFADMEVVVIDDGSSDDTVGVAMGHQLRPQVVSQPPSGHPAALNEGMKHANGRFIAFLDHDDVWPPGRLTRLLAGFEADPSPDFVFGQIVNTDANLKPIGPAAAVRLVTTALIRRSAAEAIGPFRTDIAHASPVDWVSRATPIATFSVVEELVLLRRVHGMNMGISGREIARQDMLRVIRDHHARRDK